MSGLVLALFCTAGLAAAEPPASAVTNIFVAYSRAGVAPFPTNRADIAWLGGRWVCADRALRRPPTKSSEADYAFISAVKIWGDAIEPSDVPAGFVITMVCEYLPYLDDSPTLPALKHALYSRKGFSLGVLHGDLFKLKIPPVRNPTWFLLEHVDTKDVLLFTKSGQDSDDDADSGHGE